LRRTARGDQDARVNEVSDTVIIGHRGAAARAPENTLAGLRAAKRLGVDWVEVDVQITRDGCPVLFHDARLERTTDGHGLLGDHSLAEISALDAGMRFDSAFRSEKVPRLEEAVAVLAELGLAAIFEVKSPPGRGAETARAALAVLRRLWPARLPLMLSSSDDAALAVAQEEASAIARALIVGAVPADWQARVERLGCVALHAGERSLDAALVAKLAAHVPLGAYTVNRPERARELIGWGAAAVFTDYPDVIMSAVGHGMGGPAEAGLPGRRIR
jgi:glycerophosphoryl diester phosphodiesterase